METHIVYYSCKFEGVAIIGNYCNKKAAIRAAMRKVYQLLSIDAVKESDEWVWTDEHSCISIVDLPLVDIKDLNGDSPIPHFLRYKDFIEDMPRKDLEKMRMQAQNRKKIMERINKKKSS